MSEELRQLGFGRTELRSIDTASESPGASGTLGRV
jgi:hypothetical protein